MCKCEMQPAFINHHNVAQAEICLTRIYPELELTDTQRFYAFKDGTKHYILFHPDRDNDAIGYHTNTARETIQEIR